jgi:integrase
MASIERRERRDPDGRVRVTWRVRWRDPDDRQRARSFSRRVDAERFRSTVAADLVRGQYMDPDAGKETFQSYAEQWLAAQTFDLTSRDVVERQLRLHAYPVLGLKSLRSIKPSTVQAWLRGLQDLSPTYTRMIFGTVSSILSAAVDDDLITKNPCRARSVRVPKREPQQVVPWEADRVQQVREALPERYRIAATLAAGLGLRQGEVFGLSPADVDFLRGEVKVRRQVRLFNNGKQAFRLPKGKRERTIPLPNGVREELASYLRSFPPKRVSLPWEHPFGNPVTVELVITTPSGHALHRDRFNEPVWARALRAVGVPSGRENGMHALRHFFASLLLDAGESVKAVSEYLGHTDPGFTLRTYTHLLPSSYERTRRAVDAVLGVPNVYQDRDDDTNSQVSGPA